MRLSTFRSSSWAPTQRTQPSQNQARFQAFIKSPVCGGRVGLGAARVEKCRVGLPPNSSRVVVNVERRRDSRQSAIESIAMNSIRKAWIKTRIIGRIARADHQREVSRVSGGSEDPTRPLPSKGPRRKETSNGGWWRSPSDQQAKSYVRASFSVHTITCSTNQHVSLDLVHTSTDVRSLASPPRKTSGQKKVCEI